MAKFFSDFEEILGGISADYEGILGFLEGILGEFRSILESWSKSGKNLFFGDFFSDFVGEFSAILTSLARDFRGFCGNFRGP